MTDNEENAIEETPQTAYCTQTEVDSLFVDLSDNIPDETFQTSIQNSTAWININLKRNRIPLPEITVTDLSIEISETISENLLANDGSDVNVLRTAAIYYAASDVLLTLYNGEDLPVRFDVWFNKAQSFLDAYIESYWNSDADESEQLNHQIVKHNKVLSYNQKRNRRRYF